MNKQGTLMISASLLAAVCLSACAGNGHNTFKFRCTDDSPKKDVTIDYGDSELAIKDKSQRAKEVKRDDYLVFKLKPDNDMGPNDLDYETVKVTIAGKNDASGWIATSGTSASSGGELKVCVPSNQADGTYEYFVTVEEVGTLDPRVVVVP